MSEKMTDFETAARKAADEVIDLSGYGGELSTRDAVATITKHYADLAETFGLLVELAQIVSRTVYFDDDSKVGAIINNPRIVALLAEKKG